ncbi:MAG: undecaprenyl-phosphate glucose phosphotransferase, partial [SAR324 cluster bacterium]|nr:undecaprenyl-phosphate glucose phosphotransferase [SAR324 cluster bacterium]
HSRGAFLERVLVVGDGLQADFLIERLKELKPIGIHLSGSISLAEQSSGNPGSNFLGSLKQLPQIIQQQRIDQVFISLSLKDQHRLEELKDLLSEQWVDVRIVPDLGSFRTLHTDVESFAGMPLVTLVQSPMTGWNQVLKRVLDLAGAILALILFSPLMLLIAFLVKITSPGPILYRQQRMGLDGKTFFTLKFRSMRQDAEKQTGAVWATENDTRRTTLGVYLRRFNLDELPQLFNVLNGDMSLVGPRPERPVLIEEFKSKIPNYMLRHKVKAGITGWAQINGWRGNTSLEKRIEHDLYYIERWSVWLDLKILLLTVFKGFVDPNAY